jgi:hypothetical protein
VVGALRRSGAGTHVMSVMLHPAELGSVRVLVEVRGGAMHLELRGGELAQDTLRQSLPHLREQLDQAGVSAGSIDITGHGASDRPAQSWGGDPRAGDSPDGAQRHPPPRPGPEPDPQQHPPPGSATPTVLDVRL